MQKVPVIPFSLSNIFNCCKNAKKVNVFYFSKMWQEKAKTMLQNYLDNVLVDDRLNQSEIIYSFLSPSPDYLKTASSLPPSIAR